MTTLTTPPVSTMLKRMFADAEANREILHKRREALRAQGIERDAPEYAAAMREAYMAIAPETGKLLYLLVRVRKPKLIVEFGTSFGVSATHIAAGLKDNGEGRLITTEREANKIAATRASLIEAGLADLVEIREGNAMETLATNLPGPVDLLFLDGAKHLYIDLINLLEPRFAPAALIVADNANTAGYRDYIRAQERFVSTAIDNRVELTFFAGR